MLIHIQSKHFALSEAVSKYVKSKVQLVLSRYEAKIISVNVSLFDVNGPNGGEDKCCKIIIKTNNSNSIVVQESAEDLYDAINTCTRRVRRVVKRQLSVHIRTRRKVKEVLLIAIKEADIETPST